MPAAILERGGGEGTAVRRGRSGAGGGWAEMMARRMAVRSQVRAKLEAEIFELNAKLAAEAERQREAYEAKLSELIAQLKRDG